jgi:hypothetical protein
MFALVAAYGMPLQACKTYQGKAKLMDQNLINVAATAFSAVIGWILKIVWDAIRNMQSDMKELEKDLHTKYITKDEYSRDILEIKNILMKISDKLDSKVDKR